MGYHLNIIGVREIKRAVNEHQQELLEPVVDQRSLGEELIDLQADDSYCSKYVTHLPDLAFLTGFMPRATCPLPIRPDNWRQQQILFAERYRELCSRHDAPYALVHQFAGINTRELTVQELTDFNYDQPAIVRRPEPPIKYDDFGWEDRDHYGNHPCWSSYRQVLSPQYFALVEFLRAEGFKSVILDVA